MLKLSKKILSVLLTLLMLLLSLSVCFVGFAADASGGCGGGLTWTYSDATKTLTISGNGAMDNYERKHVRLPNTNNDIYGSSAPWFIYYRDVTRIIIQNGVTKIGDFAFILFSNITKIEFPSSIETIGSNAFQECTSLVSINFGNSLKSIGERAFYKCTSLKSFTIPDQVVSIADYAFNNVPVETLVLGKNVTTIGSYAFSACKLISVTMHNKVEVIGKAAFYKQNGSTNNKISHVYYDGSQTQWNNIVIGQDNEPLTGAAIHYNSTGPTTDPVTQPTDPATQPTQPTTAAQQQDSGKQLSFLERIFQMILDFFARLFGR